MSTCSVCGMSVSSTARREDADGTICESCMLDRKSHSPSWTASEIPYVKLAEALATALDAREHETGLHSKRVACHTMVLAKHFTRDTMILRQVYWGALLHDIGKIGTPDAILLKKDRLNEEEWRVMRQHPEIGSKILAGISHLGLAAEIVLNHEERYDGTGYPRGLSGEAIPLWARLFAVIDTLDAITSDRSYRKAMPFDKAKAEILAASGSQFDPLAVDVFLKEEEVLRSMVEQKCEVSPMQAELFPSQ